VGVGLRGGDDRPDAELAAGADDPQRDLAAVGDQDLVEHARPSVPPAESSQRLPRSPRAAEWGARAAGIEGPRGTRPLPRCGWAPSDGAASVASWRERAPSTPAAHAPQIWPRRARELINMTSATEHRTNRGSSAGFARATLSGGGSEGAVE